jgi:hypothetical protein
MDTSGIVLVIPKWVVMGYALLPVNPCLYIIVMGSISHLYIDKSDGTVPVNPCVYLIHDIMRILS